MTETWPAGTANPVYQGNFTPLAAQAAELYPARYYAALDDSEQPAIVSGWYDVWNMSNIEAVPPASAMYALTPEQWEFHLKTDENGFLIHLNAAVDADGNLYDFQRPPPPVPLTVQAQHALAEARQYVSENYTMLNEPTPPEWVGYLKKLMAISSGRDKTSTSLPEQPAMDDDWGIAASTNATIRKSKK